jgi:hypothetical protein
MPSTTKSPCPALAALENQKRNIQEEEVFRKLLLRESADLLLLLG